jgi:hypothetical protein
MNTLLWVLLIMTPNDAAGRTVGPFDTQARCEAAAAAYNKFNSFRSGPQSVCFVMAERNKR